MYTLQVSKEIIINSTATKIFPLLCPVREYDWIPTWKCEMIYSNSGFNEKGCIFKTENSYGSDYVIWTTQEYDASTFTVRFTNFASSEFIILMRINLYKLEQENKCKAIFNYEFVPTSANGEQAISRINKSDIETTVTNLGELLNRYFS